MQSAEFEEPYFMNFSGAWDIGSLPYPVTGCDTLEQIS